MKIPTQQIPQVEMVQRAGIWPTDKTLQVLLCGHVSKDINGFDTKIYFFEG